MGSAMLAHLPNARLKSLLAPSVQAFAAANVVALQGSPPAIAAVRPMPRPRTIPATMAAAVDEVLTLVLSPAISDGVFPSFVYCFMDSSLKGKRPVSIHRDSARSNITGR